MIESNKTNKKVSPNEDFNYHNIKTKNGYNCIGPCYPANTVYYNPETLTAIKLPFPSCPIKKKIVEIKGQKNIIFADKCKEEDINDEYLYFDIFEDVLQIARSSNNFLKDIYNIHNISDVIMLLNNALDIMPIYSQKRILKAFYEVYYKYIEFPKLLFAEKILKVLKDIYNIHKLSTKNILKHLDKNKSIKNDIYTYFINKYS